MAQRLKTDWIMFAAIVLMVSFGLMMVYSASSVMAEIKYHSGTHFLYHQIVWAAGSFFVLMYLKRRDYRVLNSSPWAFGSLGVVLMMLTAVYFLDWRQHRWFHFGGLASLQPSEFAKPALAIFLAYFVSRRSSAINSGRYTVLPAALSLGLLAMLVVIADLGTAVVLVLTAAVVFFVAGLERRYFLVAASLGILLTTAAVAAKPYRLARVIGYIDPNYQLLGKVDPHGHIKNYVNESMTTRDPGYQARQSKIAVGTGGAFGVGLMHSKQKLFYLPEAHTDFIYAVIGEELGMFGCAAVLAGFLVLLWRGYRLYWTAPDEFGAYLALAITSSLVIQALINISVVLDLGPTKGIPLPLISFGGSSLLSSLISLGILLSVSEQSG